MEDTEKKIFEDFLSRRSSFIEIVLTIIFAALGINLLSTASANSIGNTDVVITGAFGLLLCVLVIFYITIRFLKQRSKSISVDGFIIHNKHNKRLSSIEEYSLSRSINMYLDYAFSHIEELEVAWKSNPLDNAQAEDSRLSIVVLREAIEFFVLEQLSAHLREYFNDKELSKGTKAYYGEDFRDIMQTNRFFRLYSSPQRVNPFYLILPKNSRIYRNKDGQVVVETDKFSMSIEAYFGGINILIPSSFHKYYLSIDKENVDDFTIGASIFVFMKLRMLLSFSGLKYYQWIDTFLDQIDQNMSQDRFFKSIDWNSVSMIIRHLNNLKEPSNPQLNDIPDAG